MGKEPWSLQPDVKMDEKLASDVAKIACALQSLSVFTSQALEEGDEPESLKEIVDEGMAAMKRIFIW